MWKPTYLSHTLGLGLLHLSGLSLVFANHSCK